MSDEEIEHINHALPTSGHRPMYNNHKFFARKQEDVITEYIKHYTRKGEVVLDPFCGSGVHVAEAVSSNRKGIGIDLFPFAVFISRNTIRYANPSKIKKTFKKIKNDIGEEINSLYKTKCRECDFEVPAICFTWNNNELRDVRYECPHESERRIDEVTEEDLDLYKKIERGELESFFDDNGNCKYFYPTKSLYYPDGTPFKEKQNYDSIDDMFTKRNLIALAKLLNRIKKIKEKDLRESFKFAFTSLLHLASSMTPVRSSRPYSSAWTQHSYWSASEFMESNVWSLFRRTVMKRQSLLKAKEDLPKKFRGKKEADSFSELLESSKDYFFKQGDAIQVMDEMEENSIDYVITDPPYGKSVQYGELLYMWDSWLELSDDFGNTVKAEIVENKKQDKGSEEYENMLYAAFRKVYKVLKPDRYCTVTFHNPKLKYRNILFRALVRAGFRFEKIIYQPPPRPSAKGLLQPFGSLTGDYFFRFRKPKQSLDTKLFAEKREVDKKRVEKIVVDTAKKIIAERGEPTHYTFIQNTIDPILYEELTKYGLLMDFDPSDVEDILNKQVGKEFELVDMKVAEKGQETLRGKGWWFSDPSKHKLNIPLNKRINQAIMNLLRRERVVSFTDVLTEIYTKFENALTPEEQTIKDILKENAAKEGGGKWRVKPFVRDIQKKHEEMVYYLAKLGKKCGLYVDVAEDEYSKFYKDGQLEDLLDLTKFCDDDLDSEKMKRINLIDVIWHNNEEIIAEFEVEHSTSIVDAVVRGSNIEYSSHRIIVIPDQREDIVYRRFHEPAIESILQDMEWRIITYKTLRKFFNSKKDVKKLELDEILELSREPITKEEKEKKTQKTISEF